MYTTSSTTCAKTDVWNGRGPIEEERDRKRDWHFFPLEWNKQKAAKVIAREKGGKRERKQCLHIIYDKPVPSFAASSFLLLICSFFLLRGVSTLVRFPNNIQGKVGWLFSIREHGSPGARFNAD